MANVDQPKPTDFLALGGNGNPERLLKLELQVASLNEGLTNDRNEHKDINKAIFDLRVEVNGLASKIDGVEKSLTSKIDGVEKSLNSKIEALDTKFDTKFDGLEKSINSLKTITIGLFVAFFAGLGVMIYSTFIK
jgi:chromosome segregation ATPase